MKLPNRPRVLAATYNPVSKTKMISFLVDFPTVLLAELRTHRILTQGSLYEHMELDDFNLSANSARAIPHNKYLQKVLDNPFVPIWTKQQRGMSGETLAPDEDLEYQYNYAINSAVNNYNTFLEFGVHKQNANRLLAPFAYTTCIISGTQWDNFWSLRCPKYEINKGLVFNSKKEAIKYMKTNNYHIEESEINDNVWWENLNVSTAQPEFQVIAEMLYDLYQEADWKESRYHIPFEEDILNFYGKEYLFNSVMEYASNEEFDTLTEDERLDLCIKHDLAYHELLMKISASMCAKLSYNTQDNEDTLEKHLERAEMLMKHKHQEPFSHQAVAMTEDEYENMFIQSIVKINGKKERKREMGVAYNLRGFMSQRYIIENLK